MKKISLILVLVLVLGTAARAVKANGPAQGPLGAKYKTVRTLDANAWTIYTSNFGIFVFSKNNAPGGHWGGLGHNYIYEAGLWVGGIDTSDSARVAIGDYAGTGGSEMGPINPYTGDWTHWQTDPQARVYLSTDPTDLAEWPHKDSQGRNVVISQQESYAAYSDENPVFTFTGEKPLGVRIHQYSYSWTYAGLNDVVFFYFKIKNVSGRALRNVQAGPCFDADIGDESGTVANDRTAFDYARNMGIQYQTDPEAGWSHVGQLGCRMLEGPVNNTGAVVHVKDSAALGQPTYSHDIQPGQPLGMTAFKIFTIDIDPASDYDRYLMMEGINYKTHVLDAYDELGSATPGDKRFVMSSGPFNMAAGDSITLCLAVLCALDRPSLLALSDLAQTFYDNHFELGMPPAAPVLTVRRGDGRAYLSWTKAAETAPDPFRDRLDSTVSWHAYFKGTWDRCGDTLLIDSLAIKSDSAHETAIARGAPNIWGGYKSGDTALCKYSAKALYQPYDFQGYIVYRAMGVERNLSDPGTRVTLGGLNTGSSGARGYFFDRNDGVQIVLDNNPVHYQTPDTTYYLPKYDTIGTDRGLVYAMVDSNLDNEWAYFYTVVAYDYQPNAYFTRTCPTTLGSDPLDNYQLVVPRADPIGYAPPGIAVRVDGGCDARSGGALDHLKYLMAADPAAVPDDSFKLRWTVERTLEPDTSSYTSDTIRVPFYKAKLYDSHGGYLDSTGILPRYGYNTASPTAKCFFGPSDDQLMFGGVAFKPYLQFAPALCKVDTAPIITEVSGGSRTYPADSVACVLYTNTWKNTISYWMWRGSDLEIRWRDTLVRVGSATADSAALTCTVWDVTNNVEIPFQGQYNRKADMTAPAWCFNYLDYKTDTLKYIYNRNYNSNKGIFISGITVFPNYRHMSGSAKNLVWANRPETGDVWRIHCTGPRPPVDGNISTFILSPGNPGLPDWTADGVVMYQNAPNPFADATTMSYQLMAPAEVSVNIYNITGQLVKTLVSSYQAAGAHSVRWNGDDNNGRRAATGVYLCQLKAGSNRIAKRIILVR